MVDTLLSAYPDRVLTRVLGHDSGSLVGKMFVREVLTAARTYYVRTDGSDSNTGLVDSAAGAFLTIQKAYDIAVATLDQASYTVTIQVRDGTYTAGLATNIPPFGGRIVIVGNTTTRANVLISTAGDCFYLSMYCFGFRVSIQSLKMTTSGGNAIYGPQLAHVGYSDVDFGTCAGNHVQMNGLSKAFQEGNYVITGSAQVHTYCSAGQAYIEYASLSTITLSGTLTFSSFFAGAYGQSQISAYGVTFSGSVPTATRYSVGTLSFINTFGGGPNAFPGSGPGSNDASSVYA